MTRLRADGKTAGRYKKELCVDGSRMGNGEKNDREASTCSSARGGLGEIEERQLVYLGSSMLRSVLSRHPRA